MAFSQDTNFFDFFYGAEVGDRFSVFYDPGENPGDEVYSFQGSVRWKGGNELEINYTFQQEFICDHAACYGVMILGMESRTILSYSTHDNYDDYKPSAKSMIEIFNKGDPACIQWRMWPSDSDLNSWYYDRAEWVEEEEEDEDETNIGG